MAQDWRESFVDGDVAVPEENGVAFPFGLVQVWRGAFNLQLVRLDEELSIH